MYQFSLDSYTVLFSHSLNRAQHSDNIEERNENIQQVHTLAVYNNTCRGLFEEHKLLFSFCLAIKVQQTAVAKGAEKVNPDEYLYFLRGPVGINFENMENIPSVPDWLSQKVWDFIIGLGTLPAFDGIAASFEQYGEDWRNWYMEQEPEVLPFPGEWSRKCNNLQIMLIVRCLRPDRVLNTIRRYVSTVLSPEFIVPPCTLR